MSYADSGSKSLSHGWWVKARDNLHTRTPHFDKHELHFELLSLSRNSSLSQSNEPIIFRFNAFSHPC
jgi:hypothetical protein